MGGFLSSLFAISNECPFQSNRFFAKSNAFMSYYLLGFLYKSWIVKKAVGARIGGVYHFFCSVSIFLLILRSCSRGSEMRMQGQGCITYGGSALPSFHQIFQMFSAHLIFIILCVSVDFSFPSCAYLLLRLISFGFLPALCVVNRVFLFSRTSGRHFYLSPEHRSISFFSSFSCMEVLTVSIMACGFHWKLTLTRLSRLRMMSSRLH